MHSKILFAAALVSTALADEGYNVDTSVLNRVATDVQNYAASITDTPAFSSLIPDIESASLAPSAVSVLLNDPEVVAYDIANSKGASILGPLPTNVVEDLRDIFAKPIKAYNDIDDALSSIVKDPDVTSVLSDLKSSLPSSDAQSLKANPVDFLEDIITGTDVPSWITAVPTPVQAALGTLLNEGLTVIAADFEGSSTKSAGSSKTASPGSSSASGSKSGPSSTSSVVAFTGAGSKVQVGAAAGALVAFAGLLVLL